MPPITFHHAGNRLSVFGVGLLLITGCTPSQVVQTKNQEKSQVAVKTVAVTQADVQRTTRQPATIHAYHRAELRAQSTGFVTELKADIGDYVEAGAVLAIIAVPELDEQRKIAESKIRRLTAEERRAEAGIALADAGVRSAMALLEESKSQRSGVEAKLAAAEAEFRRTQDLVQRGSLQNRMLDEVRMKRDSEKAQEEAVTAAVDSAEARVTVAEARTASARADLDAARADTEIARRELKRMDVLIQYSRIKAPFTGVVTERNIEPGDLVREANEVGMGRPLFAISQIDRVRVRIPVPESDAPLVSPGDEVSLTFPSFSAESPILGTVTRRSGNLDQDTRTMLVEVDLDNSSGKLLPGMFGQATIRLSSKIAANLLPSQAIRFGEDGRAFVYVVDDQNLVSVTEITTGIDDGNSIEVLSGITSGQRVVGPHLKRFSNGQKVAVLEPGK